jgi:hypothetical protein
LTKSVRAALTQEADQLARFIDPDAQTFSLRIAHER